MNSLRTIVYFLAFLVLLLTFLLFLGRNSSYFIDKDTTQAVFLTDGQVYFGFVEGINKSFINLNNVYYLEESAAVGLADDNESELTLIKLGSEIHEPQGSLHINKEAILFIENLKADSRIITAINQYSN